ncbi:MAG: glycosyltransferase [Solirubrobacterales bacterium]
MTLVDGIGLGGGGERLAREIITRLDRERFDRTLCVSRWPPGNQRAPAVAAALAELDQAGVRFLGLQRGSALNVAAWRSLLTTLRRERVDILHAHKFGSNLWAAILGPLARTPVVIAHEHTWSFEGQPVRRFIDRHLIARRANAFLTVSREDRRRMIEIERIDPAKLIFVPNGIPPSPTPSGRDVRAQLGLVPQVPVVGTVCALRPQKALDVLVRAAAALRGRFTTLRVLIVGDGPERPALERQIGELRLGETVTLLGHRSDVPDVLRAFDVAVCSSNFEGTPLSILEYMEAGLPVVATRVGGVPDLIEPGEHGLLVEPGDPGALAKALAELLGDHSRRAEMGRRGRERRRREFDIEVTVGRVARIYEALARGEVPAIS